MVHLQVLVTIHISAGRRLQPKLAHPAAAAYRRRLAPTRTTPIVGTLRLRRLRPTLSADVFCR